MSSDNDSDRKIVIIDTDSVLLICCFVLYVLTAGDPDLLDGIIYWLSDGSLGPQKEKP